jgi:hypothetical protein
MAQCLHFFFSFRGKHCVKMPNSTLQGGCIITKCRSLFADVMMFTLVNFLILFDRVALIVCTQTYNLTFLLVVNCVRNCRLALCANVHIL